VIRRAACAAVLIAVWAGTAAAETVWLDELNVGRIRQDRLFPRKKRAVRGAEMTIAGRKFTRGVGTHARSRFFLQLDGGVKRFSALVGVDDEAKGTAARVEFRILADGKQVWSSGVMKAGDAAKPVDLDLSGVKALALLVADGGNGIDNDHADWADARFEVTGARPKGVTRLTQTPTILTPAPSKSPRINGPSVFGVRPGSPVLYSVPTTGERPIRFSAACLPEGLTLDANTGRITGSVAKAGSYDLTIRASNARGKTERKLGLVVGEQIALTPPLGWNSWNCWGDKVDQDKVLAAARAMVASGLADHGWTYINIDDGWQAKRAAPDQPLQANEKFPDMKGLCDAIHAMGLKVGIYSTPWVTSYAGYPGGSTGEVGYVGLPQRSSREDMVARKWYEGKVGCEGVDAKQFAAWGIDYLKYDWNPIEVPAVKRMRAALRASGRDIVYSLSNTAPLEGAGDWAKLANCWRTTGDIEDSWRSMAGIGFEQDPWKKFAGPGHWNDSDMLVVGHVGWGKPHPSKLTGDEQYTHISLWCLLSSPLLLGCDMTKLDDFTIALLSNDEVLAVNQDPLGRQAGLIAKDTYTQVWAKDLAGGGKAVGLFSLDDFEPHAVTVKWSDLGIKGKHTVRDLWRQKDLGAFDEDFQIDVPPHGVVLIRISEKKS
jgi:alpha-galactosidase